MALTLASHGCCGNLVGVATPAHIAVGQHDLRRQCGRRQDLRNQRVRVKRDWAQQLVKLRGRKRLIGRASGAEPPLAPAPSEPHR